MSSVTLHKVCFFVYDKKPSDQGVDKLALTNPQAADEIRLDIKAQIHATFDCSPESLDAETSDPDIGHQFHEMAKTLAANHDLTDDQLRAVIKSWLSIVQKNSNNPDAREIDYAFDGEQRECIKADDGTWINSFTVTLLQGLNEFTIKAQDRSCQFKVNVPVRLCLRWVCDQQLFEMRQGRIPVPDWSPPWVRKAFVKLGLGDDWIRSKTRPFLAPTQPMDHEHEEGGSR